jgi:hypothetical protein
MGLRNKNISTVCVTVTTLLKMFKTICPTGYESATNYQLNVANLTSGQEFNSKTLQ